MHSRNPGPRRVWNEALPRGRWRRLRRAIGNARRVIFAHFRCKKWVEIICVLPKLTPKQPDVLAFNRTDVFC